MTSRGSSSAWREANVDCKTQKIIEDFAWDVTVGAGVDPETKPNMAMLFTLAKRVGHPLDAEEIFTFEKAWKRCVQEMQQL